MSASLLNCKHCRFIFLVCLLFANAFARLHAQYGQIITLLDQKKGDYYTLDFGSQTPQKKFVLSYSQGRGIGGNLHFNTIEPINGETRFLGASTYGPSVKFKNRSYLPLRSLVLRNSPQIPNNIGDLRPFNSHTTVQARRNLFDHPLIQSLEDEYSLIWRGSDAPEWRYGSLFDSESVPSWTIPLNDSIYLSAGGLSSSNSKQGNYLCRYHYFPDSVFILLDQWEQIPYVGYRDIISPQSIDDIRSNLTPQAPTPYGVKNNRILIGNGVRLFVWKASKEIRGRYPIEQPAANDTGINKVFYGFWWADTDTFLNIGLNNKSYEKASEELGKFTPGADVARYETELCEDASENIISPDLNWLLHHHDPNNDFPDQSAILYALDFENTKSKLVHIIDLPLLDTIKHKYNHYHFAFSPNGKFLFQLTSSLYYIDSTADLNRRVGYTGAKDIELTIEQIDLSTLRSTTIYQYKQSIDMPPFRTGMSDSLWRVYYFYSRFADKLGLVLLPNGKILINRNWWQMPFQDIPLKEPQNVNIIHEPNQAGELCRIEMDSFYENLIPQWSEISRTWDYRQLDFETEAMCDGTVRFTNLSDTQTFDRYVFYFPNGDSVVLGKNWESFQYRFKKTGKHFIYLHGSNEDTYSQWYEKTIIIPFNQLIPEPHLSINDSSGCQWVAVEVTDKTDYSHTSGPIKRTIDWGDGSEPMVLANDFASKSFKHEYSESGWFRISLILNNDFCADTVYVPFEVHILPAPRPGIFTDTLRLCQTAAFDVGRLYSDSLRSVQWQLIGPDNRDTTFVFDPPLSQHEKAPIWRMNGLPAGDYILKQSLIGASSCINTDSMRLRVMPDLPNELPVFSHIQANEQHIRIYTDTLSGLLMRLLPDDLLSNDGRFDVSSGDTSSRAVELRYENHCKEMAEQGSTAYLPALSGNMEQVGENHLIYYSTGIAAEQTYVTIRSRKGFSEVMLPEGSSLLHIDVYDPDNENTRCYRLMQKHPDGDTSFSREICLDVPFLLFLPNAFSPDGDGLNDVWKPVSAGAEWVHLRIYDRWGGLLYDEKSLSPQWNGKNAIQGVYSYTLEIYTAEGNKHFKQGTLQLLR